MDFVFVTILFFTLANSNKILLQRYHPAHFCAFIFTFFFSRELRRERIPKVIKKNLNLLSHIIGRDVCQASIKKKTR